MLLFYGFLISNTIEATKKILYLSKNLEKAWFNLCILCFIAARLKCLRSRRRARRQSARSLWWRRRRRRRCSRKWWRRSRRPPASSRRPVSRMRQFPRIDDETLVMQRFFYLVAFLLVGRLLFPVKCEAWKMSSVLIAKDGPFCYRLTHIHRHTYTPTLNSTHTYTQHL